MQHSQQSPLDKHRSICEIQRVELDTDKAVIPEVGNMIYKRGVDEWGLVVPGLGCRRRSRERCRASHPSVHGWGRRR